MIGVHTPELPEERVESNVRKAVESLGIEYPVLLDQEEINWRRWRQQYWPTVYIVDRQGFVRYVWIGELNRGGSRGDELMRAALERLIAETDRE